MMQRFLLILAVLLALVSHSVADNSHGQPNDIKEMGSWFGDLTSPYIAFACLPGVPSSSLTLAAFGCKGYVRGSGGELIYVDQDPVTITLVNTTGTHWLALSGDTTSLASGWTRRPGSHYLFRQVTNRPSDPPQGQVFASIDVAGGVITAVTDYRIPRSLVLSQTYDPLDPLYGAVGDGVTDDLAALQAWINGSGKGVWCLTLPARTFRISGTLTFTVGGGCLQGAGNGPMGSTTLLTSSPTADMLSVTAEKVTLRDFTMKSSVPRTAGAGISLTNATGSAQNQVIQNVTLDGMHNGIVQLRSSSVTIRDSVVRVASATGAGIFVQDLGTTCGETLGIYSGNFIIGPTTGTSPFSKAMAIEAGGGVVFSDNQIEGFSYGVTIAPDATCPAASGISQFNFINNRINNSTVTGILVQSTALIPVVAVQIVGNGIATLPSSSNTKGLSISGKVTNFIVTNNTIFTGTNSFGIHFFGDGVSKPALGIISNNFMQSIGGNTGIATDLGASVTILPNVPLGYTTPFAIGAGPALLGGISIPFAQLVNGAPGSNVYCTDCGFVSSVTPACTSGGPGAHASRNATVWNCR